MSNDKKRRIVVQSCEDCPYHMPHSYSKKWWCSHLKGNDKWRKSVKTFPKDCPLPRFNARRISL